MYTAYWRPVNSNFICIEPWQGLNSKNTKNYDLEKENDIEKLEKGEIFTRNIIFKFENIGEIEK